MIEYYSSFDELGEEVQNYPLFWATYTALDTYEHRINYVSSIVDYLPKKIPDFTAKMGKSSVISLTYRIKGDRNFEERKFLLALQNLSLSIAHAPLESGDLHLSFATRACVLLTMGQFNESIIDINRAAESGYPIQKIYKLSRMKGRCLEKIGNYEEAILNFNLAKEQLKYSSLNSEERKQENEELDQDTKECQRDPSSCTSSLSTSRDNSSTAPPEVSYDPNPDIDGTSSCIKLAYHEKFGLHFVAARDINTGDVLISIDRYTSYLYFHHIGTRCYACMKKCVTLLPCTTCSYAMFCSEDCWEENKEQHLTFGCKFLAQLTSLKITCPSVLAYKILTEASFEKTLQEYQLWKNSENLDPLTRTLTNGRFELNIHSIFNVYTFNELNSNVDSTDRNFKFMLRACALVPVLKNFVENPHEFIPILFFLYLYDFKNSLPAMEVQDSTPLDFKRDLFGTVCTMPITFTQHSCCANSEWFIYGTKEINYATAFIKEGVRITSTRIGNFADIKREYRQAFIWGMLNFICECQACNENWPTCNDYRIPDLPIYLTLEEFLQCELSFEIVKDLWPNNGLTNQILNKSQATRVTKYLNILSSFGGQRCLKFIMFRYWLMLFWHSEGKLV